MSETILKCFLLKEQEYSTFDSILTLLTNRNQILMVYAQGTKKILSKNSRNLIYGDMLEIEFFQSRSYSSLSKLKKIKSIKNTKPLNYWDHNLYIINEFISTMKYFNFNEYIEIISTLDKYKDETGLIYVLYKIIKISKVGINLSLCSICGSNKIKTISIDKKGYICNECAIKNNEYIHETEFNRSFIKINNNDFEYVNKLPFKKQLINFLKSYINMNVGYNIFKYLEVK